MANLDDNNLQDLYDPRVDLLYNLHAVLTQAIEDHEAAERLRKKNAKLRAEVSKLSTLALKQAQENSINVLKATLAGLDIGRQEAAKQG